MKTSIVFLFFCLGIAYISQNLCVANNGKTAYTTPISGITIDGKLDDWPEGLEIYPIDWVSPRFYNPIPPDGPEDITANFRTGYSIDENLLYVAVVVNDDDVVVQLKNPNVHNQDVCGIYIDADNSGGDTEISGRQLYAMVPGEGKWTKNKDGNPSLGQGQTEASGVKGEYFVLDNQIVYEWAIPLFDSFPDKRSLIEAGKRIGLDFLVADADRDEEANYITWSPEAGKSRNSDLFGELVFINSYDELGSLEGRISSVSDNNPLGGISMEVYQNDTRVELLKTSNDGNFGMKILPGEYSLRVLRGQGIKTPDEMVFVVKRKKKMELNIRAELIILPELLDQALEQFEKLKSYRDTTIIETRTQKPGMDDQMTETLVVEYKKPRHLKIQNAGSTPGYGVEMYYNDSSRIIYHQQWKQYLQNPTLPTIEATDIEFIQSTIIKDIILRKNPRKEFMKGIVDIREDGNETINGEKTIRYALTKPYSSMESFLPVTADELDIIILFWVRSKDKLIVKMSYTIDMGQLLQYLEEEMRESLKESFGSLVITISERHSGIEIDPDLPDKNFLFNPQEDSKLVKQFTRPARPEKSPSELIGKMAPEFGLKDLAGEKVSPQGLMGNVIFIDFWATWCGPCVKSMPHIQELSEKFKDEGLIVLGINTWERDTQKVKPFIKEHGITYRILLDSDNAVITKYFVSGIPSFFILDKKGIIRYASTGFNEDNTEMISNIESLLKE